MNGVQGRQLETVRAVVDWHIGRLGIANSPTHRERVRILRFFTEQFGDRRIDAIDADDLLTFINGRGLTTWTRRRWCNTVKSPFFKAAKAGRIPFNPFCEISVPQGDRGRDITRNEWQRLMRASCPYFRRVLVFLRFTGARPGELRNLTWDKVRSDVRAAIFPTHKTSATQREKKPRRVALNSVALKLLTWLGCHGRRSTYVFVNRDRRQWTTGAICCHLRRLRVRVGLPSDVKLYGCRHAYGTGAILNGVELATLAELMGHENVEMTRYYVHLSGRADHLSAAAELATSKLT